MQPAVHAVGNAGEGEGLPVLRQLGGLQLVGVGEVQLKVQRHEVRAPQLLRHIQHHLVHIRAQAAEQVHKAAGFLLKIVELAVNVVLHKAVGHLMQLLVAEILKAAALLRLLRRLFQDGVHEGADLGRGEARRLIGLGAQTVLAEIGIAAGREAVDFRRAQADPLPVERLHRPGRELSARHGGRLLEPRVALRLLPLEPRRRGRRPRVPAPNRLGGQGQRRAWGGEPRRVGVAEDGGLFKQRRGAGEHKGRTAALPVGARQGIAQIQPLRRQGEGGVEQGKFPPELVFLAADVDIQLKQPLPLLAVEHPAALLGAGDAVVAAPEHQQMPESPTAHPVKIPGGHPVERHRDDAHVVLGEHPREELPEGGAFHLAVPEDRRALLEGVYQDIPELAVFGGQGGVALRLQGGGAFFQLPGKLPLLQQRGQCRRLPGGGFGLVTAAVKAQQGCGETAAQGVERSKLRLALLVKGHPVAIRVLSPVLVPLPGPGTELPLEHIVGQQVTLLGVQPGEPRAQEADDIVHLPAALGQLVDQRDQRRERLGQQLTAPGGKQRDAVVLKDALQRGAVVLKAPHGHGDLPPAAALFAHQREDMRRGGLALAGDALRRDQRHRRFLPCPARAAVTEDLLREPAQRVVLARLPLADLHRRLTAEMLRLAQQTQRRQTRQAEQLAVPVERIHRQTDCERRALLQQRRQYCLLLIGEIKKAVHIDLRPGAEGAVCDTPREHREAVGRVSAAVCNHGVKARGDQGEIAQLLPQRVPGPRGRPFETLRRNAGGFQLVELPQ